jgi:hypothetical protein
MGLADDFLPAGGILLKPVLEQAALLAGARHDGDEHPVIAGDVLQVRTRTQLVLSAT